MKKVLLFLKQNVAFFVIFAIALTFYFIAIFGGDYQTAKFQFVVTHYTFINGIDSGVPLAFAYVIVPVICLIGILLLHIFKPVKRDGKKALVFTSLLIGLAFVAGVFIGMIPVALFNQASPSYTSVGDWLNQTNDVFYTKTYSFPYLSMVLSLFAIIVLGCYSSATLSE